jgi:hypothetical protein
MRILATLRRNNLFKGQSEMLQQATAQESFAPTMTLLNSTGDVTITWDEKEEASIFALVEAKMKEGYSFFILKPRRFGLPGHTKARVKSVEALKDANHVVVPDDLVQHIVKKALGDRDVEKVVQGGQATLVSADSRQRGNLDTVRRATSAQEVVKHQTVAIRPVVAG